MRLIAKTLYGFEELLASEVAACGGRNIRPVNRAVLFDGDMDTLYSVNYSSRTALSVLLELSAFSIDRSEVLYDNAARIEWESIMSADDTFAVVSVVNSPFFRHTAYPGLVVKDAIADYFRKKSGVRPGVDTSHPRILVNLHISNRDVVISADSSLVPLFKRGYRKAQGQAPLNESLAAGMIMLTGWKGECDFHDPMCGSGTIPVEAGLIAGAIPPGYFREFFGFQNWKNYDSSLFGRVKDRFNSKMRTVKVSVSGSDKSHQAVILARQTVVNAGLAGEVRIFREDFLAEDTSPRGGFMIFNPPYGKRIDPGKLAGFYSEISSKLKHRHTGSEVWIFSGAHDAMKAFALQPSRRIKLFNGSIECQFNRYLIREGKYGRDK